MALRKCITARKVKIRYPTAVRRWLAGGMTVSNDNIFSLFRGKYICLLQLNCSLGEGLLACGGNPTSGNGQNLRRSGHSSG